MLLAPLAVWSALVGCFGADPGEFRVETINERPTCEIVAPLSSDVFLATDLIRIEVRATDVDGIGDLDGVILSSSLDGALGSVRGEEIDGAFQGSIQTRLSLGEHTVTCAVTDLAGNRGESESTVVVGTFAAPPQVEILQPEDGAQLYPGQTVRLLGQASDARYSPAELQYAWTITHLPTGATLTPEGTTVADDGRLGDVWRPTELGDVVVSVVVTNPGGGEVEAAVTVTVGEPPTTDDDGDGLSPAEGDCDDTRADIYPGAREEIDGEDEDCDGLIDEGTDAYDDDGDGYCEGPDACTDPRQRPGDCDDDDITVSPSHAEVCDEEEDHVDENCNGEVEEENALGCIRHWVDEDNDGWGVEPPPSKCLCEPELTHRATQPGDCDDKNRAVHPGAEEKPNRIDDDCDKSVDEDLDRTDLDGDGYCADSGACANPNTLPGDCDDTNGAIHPGARERCDTPDVDEDCDGDTNGLDALLCKTRWADRDADGWGDSTDRQCWCEPPFPYTQSGSQLGDCDDRDASVHPGQTLYFDVPSKGTGTFDYNCSRSIEYSEVRSIYQCYFDIDGNFCDVQNLGWVGLPPDCGFEGDYSNDCKAGFFSCSAKNITKIKMRCR